MGLLGGLGKRFFVDPAFRHAPIMGNAVGRLGQGKRRSLLKHPLRLVRLPLRKKDGSS
jgi:hypothetical protein